VLALVLVLVLVPSHKAQCHAPSPTSVKSNSKNDIHHVPYWYKTSPCYFLHLHPLFEACEFFFFFTVFHLPSFDDAPVSSLLSSYRFFTFLAASLFLTRVAAPLAAQLLNVAICTELTRQTTRRAVYSFRFKTRNFNDVLIAIIVFKYQRKI